jgi:hypothetical protein
VTLVMVALRLVAICLPIEPVVVIVEVATFQIFVGRLVIIEPIDVEAFNTCVVVLPFTTAAIEVEAVVRLVFVFAFTSATTEVEAVCTSLSVARDPAVRPAPVRVRVAEVQTSAARVPKVVREREPEAHTFAGMEVIMLPILVEAVLVFALTKATTEVEALETVVFVLVLIAVWELVMAAPREVVAVVTSLSVASDPLERPAPVSVLVADAHTSEASVPNVERVRVVLLHTALGRRAKSDEEAFPTVVLVFAFTLAVPAVIAAAIEVEAVFVFALIAVWELVMALARDEVCLLYTSPSPRD